MVLMKRQLIVKKQLEKPLNCQDFAQSFSNHIPYDIRKT